MVSEDRAWYIATKHGFWQILPPQPLPDPEEISDQERYEAMRKYIMAKYAATDPWVTGAIMNEEQRHTSYGTEIHQQLLDWFNEEVEAGRLCSQCGGPAAAPRGDCDDKYHHQEGPRDVKSR